MFRPRILGSLQNILKIQPLHNMNVKRWDNNTPTRPFDNMPFIIKNRFGGTLKFTIFFGVALWSPFVILWYMMAKGAM